MPFKQLNAFERLRRAGFLDTEIIEFTLAVDPSGRPQTINLNNRAFTMMMVNRKKWVYSLIKRGWQWGEIVAKIGEYYEKSKQASPWDFLKVEYPKKKTASSLSTRRRILQRLKAGNTRYKPRGK